jgi:DNA-binding NarL/FixJ family response regulator
MTAITVVVADDHSVVRSGLRALLATVDDIDIIGEAATGTEAIQLVDEHLPDVVLMDVQMPNGDGIEATRAITARHPSVSVLILTMYDDDDTVFAALRAGARGYLLKGAEQHDVVRSIVSVAAGHVTLGPGAAERAMAVFAADSPTQPLFPELTERERDVLRLVAEGHNNPTIARALYVSPKTIANHVSNILTKLHFADRAEAIVTARRAGLTTDGPPPT